MPGLLRPAATLFPDQPETLHGRRARDSVLPEAASHSIGFVSASEGRVRHAREFPAKIVQLRFIQPIRVQLNHLKIVRIIHLTKVAALVYADTTEAVDPPYSPHSAS